MPAEDEVRQELTLLLGVKDFESSHHVVRSNTASTAAIYHREHVEDGLFLIETYQGVHIEVPGGFLQFGGGLNWAICTLKLKH